MKVIRVALDVPLPRLFDYRLDEDCSVSKGQRVSVPFGSSRGAGRSTVAVVFEVDVDTQIDVERLKPVLKILDDTPALSAEWLDLVKFCAAYYQRPIGEAVFAALPPGLRSGRPAPRPPGVLRPVQPLDSLLAMLPATARRKRQALQAFAPGPLDESAIAALPPADRTCLRQMTRDGLLVREDAPASVPQFVAAHALNAEQAEIGRAHV